MSLPSLNWDGDQNEFVSLAASQTQFDMDGDGVLERTSWLDSGDAFLVLDRNGNGLVDNVTEISFRQDKAGAMTDLEGLRAYDSNGDGVLDGGDERFGAFQLWFDNNLNGVTDAGELLTLAEAGVASLDLVGVPDQLPPRNPGENIVYNRTTATRTDGSIVAALDIGLAHEAGGAADTPATQHAGWDGELEQGASLPPVAVGDDTAEEGTSTASDTAATPVEHAQNATNTGSPVVDGVKAPDASGHVLAFDSHSFDRKAKRYAIEARNGELHIRARNQSTDRVVLGGASTLDFSNGTFGLLAPVILDLDGDGIEMKSRKKAKACFDMNGDGVADDTGWVGKGDGFLVIDRNNDGMITDASELSLLAEKPDASSGLGALASLDVNGDGKLDSHDARFAELKVWRDADGDGQTGTGELLTLGDLNITEIGLRAQTTDRDWKVGENILLGTATFKRGDGSTGAVGDAALAFKPGATLADRDPRRLFAALENPGDRALESMREVLGEGRQAQVVSIERLDDRTTTSPASDASPPVEVTDPRVAQMVQAMAGFGLSAAETERLIRSNSLDQYHLAASAA